jgi:hypothetical protein
MAPVSGRGASVSAADLTDAEIDRACAGLKQNAAKVRHLRDMGLCVRQAPDGSPLVNRAHYDAVTSGAARNGAKASRHAEPMFSIPT